MIANILTLSRIPLSLLLIKLDVKSSLFIVIYIICGLTDVLDGFIARKMHTESELGEKLDSVSDIVFFLIYAIKITPILNVPRWLIIWIILIFLIKVTCIIILSRRNCKLTIRHTLLNKLTGLLIFVFPLIINITDMIYSVSIISIVATITLIDDINWLIKTRGEI